MIIFFTICLFTVVFSKTKSSKITYSSYELKKYILYSILIFLLAIIFEHFLVTFVQFVMNIDDFDYLLENRIIWFDGDFSFTLRMLIMQIFMRFILISTQTGAWFFFWLLIIAFFLFNTKKDNIIYKVLIFLSLFTFSIVFGQVQFHRMSIGFAYFAMFALIYVFLVLEQKKLIRYLIIVLSILFCFHSAQELHTAFEYAYIKSSYEQSILKDVGNDIRSYFGEDANIFLGGYVAFPRSISDQPLLTRRDSFQGRAIMALGRRLNLDNFANFQADVIISHYFFWSYTHVLRNASQPIKIGLLNHVGNDFETCDVTQEFAQEILDDMEVYPNEGYLNEVDNCVFVRLN